MKLAARAMLQVAIWAMDGVEVAWTLGRWQTCVPGAKRQYVDRDTTVVDCEGSVMDNAVAFANMNAFFTEVTGYS